MADPFSAWSKIKKNTGELFDDAAARAERGNEVFRPQQPPPSGRVGLSPDALAEKSRAFDQWMMEQHQRNLAEQALEGQVDPAAGGYRQMPRRVQPAVAPSTGIPLGYKKY